MHIKETGRDSLKQILLTENGYFSSPALNILKNFF